MHSIFPYPFSFVNDKSYYDKVTQLLSLMETFIPEIVYGKEIKKLGTDDLHQRETLYNHISQKCADDILDFYEKIKLADCIERINQCYAFYEDYYRRSKHVYEAHDMDGRRLNVKLVNMPVSESYAKFYILKDFIVGSFGIKSSKKYKGNAPSKYKHYIAHANRMYAKFSKQRLPEDVEVPQKFRLNEDFVLPFLNFSGNIGDMAMCYHELFYIITLLYTGEFLPQSFCEIAENLWNIMLFVLERSPRQWAITPEIYPYISYYSNYYTLFEQLYINMHSTYFWNDYVGKNSFLYFSGIIVSVLSKLFIVHDNSLSDIMFNFYTKDKYKLIALYDFIESHVGTGDESKKSIPREYPYFPYITITKKDADKIINE